MVVGTSRYRAGCLVSSEPVTFETVPFRGPDDRIDVADVDAVETIEDEIAEKYGLRDVEGEHGRSISEDMEQEETQGTSEL
jgi:hypothetical protein